MIPSSPVRGQSEEWVAYKPTMSQGYSWEPWVESEVLEIGQGRSNTVGRGRVGSGRGRYWVDSIMRAGTQAR